MRCSQQTTNDDVEDDDDDDGDNERFVYARMRACVPPLALRSPSRSASVTSISFVLCAGVNPHMYMRIACSMDALRLLTRPKIFLVVTGITRAACVRQRAFKMCD